MLMVIIHPEVLNNTTPDNPEVERITDQIHASSSPCNFDNSTLFFT